MRQSNDQLADDGTILNGFDYNVQVWVSHGIVQGCNHPRRWRRTGFECCKAHQYSRYRIQDVPGHEIRR